ncbi:MAG: Phosphate-selective porin O and P [Candidatus Omnitrophica bacterium ADurb.Bin277]|nr:MAG: Phosphate-selective porin O and P [Candidatus Omnitrophica bacterium ADurb.Bin277]
MRKLKWLTLTAIMASLFLGGGRTVLFAADAELIQLVQAMKKQIEAQEIRIRQLEADRASGAIVPSSGLEKDVALLKQQYEAHEEVRIKAENEAPIVSASPDGFGLRSREGDFEIKLKGQVQADGRFFANDGTPSGSNTFLIRRARPILEGRIFKYFNYKLMPDFGGDGSASIVDAYIDFKYWRSLSLRVGKSKVLGLERLQPDAHNRFPELSLASNLVPNRDIGASLFGELWNGVINYSAGVYNGSVDYASNTRDSHDDKDFIGWIFLHPFKNSSREWLKGLGMGFGGSAGTSHSSNLPSYKSFGQNTFLQYLNTVSGDGNRYRFSPNFYYYLGPLGVLGEYVRSSQDLRRTDTNETSAFHNQAGQIMVSYVLTGEKSSYRGVSPKKNFDPAKGTWGAFEVVSRIDWFDADKENLARFADLRSYADRAMGWGLGLNWYLNKNLKFMTAFEQTFFDKGGLAKYGDKNRTNENAFIGRLQLVF